MYTTFTDHILVHHHLSHVGLVQGDICPGTVLLSNGLSDAGKTTGILVDWDAVRPVPTAVKDARQDLTVAVSSIDTGSHSEY